MIDADALELADLRLWKGRHALSACQRFQGVLLTVIVQDKDSVDGGLASAGNPRFEVESILQFVCSPF